ncbi:MAG TPA: hypothetical protein VHI52_18755 [Verrucomicrobiae bacterium]|jgi:hypothetical protein|nr:hypothetical protein [Verrucomicrobiae bacterium]HWC00306.1 hypothetical protein [Bryobacteraceae bacterium]
MADLASTVWGTAVRKQEARRQLGTKAGKRGLTEGVFLEDLKKLGTILLSSMPKPKTTSGRQNYATVVTAYWPYEGNGNDLPLLFAVMKLADTSSNIKAQLLLEGRKLKLIDDEQQLIFIDDVQTNLHAEMAVVQYLCVHEQIRKENLGGLLEVYCSGKGVCQDCSGWMTKHRIVHAPLSGAPSPTGWRNPLTNALYKASGENLVYTKGLLQMSHFNREYGGPYKGNVQI